MARYLAVESQNVVSRQLHDERRATPMDQPIGFWTVSGGGGDPRAPDHTSPRSGLRSPSGGSCTCSLFIPKGWVDRRDTTLTSTSVGMDVFEVAARAQAEWVAERRQRVDLVDLTKIELPDDAVTVLGAHANLVLTPLRIGVVTGTEGGETPRDSLQRRGCRRRTGQRRRRGRSSALRRCRHRADTSHRVFLGWAGDTGSW